MVMVKVEDVCVCEKRAGYEEESALMAQLVPPSYRPRRLWSNRSGAVYNAIQVVRRSVQPEATPVEATPLDRTLKLRREVPFGSVHPVNASVFSMKGGVGRSVQGKRPIQGKQLVIIGKIVKA